MPDTAIPTGASADPQATWTQADWDEFNDHLYRLNGACGAAGWEDRARVLIAFCIGEGIVFLGRIVNLVAPLGFDKTKLAALMTKDRGGWFRTGADKVVTLLNG